MLTASERLIKGQYEKEGWQVFKIAWPDFIACKGGRVKLIEAKYANGRLSKQQRESFLLLQMIGFEIEIGWMKSPIDKKVIKKPFDKDDPFLRATNSSLKQWYLSPQKEAPIKLVPEKKKEEWGDFLRAEEKAESKVYIPEKDPFEIVNEGSE